MPRADRLLTIHRELDVVVVTHGGDDHLWDDLSKHDDSEGGSDNGNKAASAGQSVEQNCQRVVHLDLLG